MAHPWHRLPAESKAAYAAFQFYLEHGSIDAAWRATNQGQTSNAKRAPGTWAIWSSKYDWVKRAAAYAEHLAEQDRRTWERRRRQLQEADWSEAQQARTIILSALPEASRFIQRQERFVKGADGAPNQLIVTESFNIAGLMRAMSDASKLQRLATDEPTEHTKLSGAALDAYIASQLARLNHGPEASPGDAAGADATETDAGTE